MKPCPWAVVQVEEMNDTLSGFEQTLGYTFVNKSLLTTALSHRSLGEDNNERLEYLGDALLGFIIAETLYQQYPDASEGELTRLRASLVKGETLGRIARELHLGNHVLLGGGELKSGGWRRTSILANTLEAIIGAIYLDAGFDTCRDRVLSLFADIIRKTSPDNLVKDPKTRLQEYLQSRQLHLPEYNIVMERGESHARTFTVECAIPGLEISVQAEGRNKRSAEQAAAQLALVQLNI
jgi:ribonuclease-3